MPTTNLSLRIRSDRDALHRVICTCRRRNVRIVRLNYSDGRLALTVTGVDRQLRGIDRWLAALVDVFEVEHDEPIAASSTRSLAWQ